jgi:hypothetical protein
MVEWCVVGCASSGVMLAEAIASCGAETLTRTRLRWLDQSLARLGHGEARLRLGLGEAVDELASSGGIRELGMSSVKAYVIERCERRWKWGVEAQTMARRLRNLPEIHSALMEGRMLWSMAELLCRHATPENEAELVAAARGRTVRAMKQRLTVRTDVAAWWERDDDELQEVRFAMGIGEVAIVEATRLLVERIDGVEASDGRFVDALLGEGQTAMLDLERNARAAAVVDEEEERRLEREARAREARERARELAEGAIAPVVPIGVVDGSERPLGGSAREIDAEVLRCCRALLERDLEIGQLWRVFAAQRGWLALGYADAEQYARERVGMSLSSLKQRARFARYVERLPALAVAVEAGRIGFEAAMLVGRVATPTTVDAWIERAAERTVKHLSEEVKAVSLQRELGDEGPLLPPDARELEEVAEFERASMSGELLQDLFRGKPPGRQISVPAGSGREVRLRVSAGQAAALHRLRCRFERVAPPGASFLAWLCLAVWDAWAPIAGEVINRWDYIYRRDRYRCASPVCTRRELTAHHLRFRSHGGSDHEHNIITLCSVCHLSGIHGGTLRASPPASRIRWEIGRDPIMIVEGRTRRRLAPC